MGALQTPRFGVLVKDPYPWVKGYEFHTYKCQ